ncbi:MAG: InlB B-repeat-containing protein, partial [Butyrivibrio sp.]|nr:InlB B-repeat-containing protein [Butyrivibrio sp.]
MRNTTSKIFAWLLTLAMVVTSFGSDITSIKTFAEGDTLPEETLQTDGEKVENESEGDIILNAGSGSGTIDEETNADTYKVTFYVDDEEYATMDVTKDTAIGTMPEDPVKDGFTFLRWEDEEANTITADSIVTAALKVNAIFEQTTELPDEEEVTTEYTVTYLVDGTTYAEQVYTDDDNALSLPEKPFKAGYFFRGWEKDGEAVNDGYKVTESFTLTALLEEIKIFQATVNYYYINPSSGEKVIFDNSTQQVEKNNLPATIMSPTDIAVGSEVDAEHPVYYPTESYKQITQDYIDANLDTMDIVQEGSVYIGILPALGVKYIPYEINYYAVYMLKDLDGEGYSEVDRAEYQTIVGANITANVKDIEGGVFEKTETVTITEAGQEVHVYYTRAHYTLHYETNGGSYIESVTDQYGATINLTAATPERAGYKFEGWYTDEGCTQKAEASFVLEADTTIYAKWTAQKVNYTVVYLIENADDNGYSFLTSKVEQAVTGTSVTKKATDSTPSALDRTNFTFKDSTTETIKADGTTVITVRYSRNVYTITWKGVWYKYSSWNRTFTEKKVSGRASLTAKYGSNITALWYNTFNKPYPDYAWNFTTDNDDKFVNIDTMPSGNKEVYAFDYVTDNVQTLNYWLENYDGEETVTKFGKTYGLYKSLKVKFNFLYYDADFYEIVGYTKYKAEFTNGYEFGDHTWDGLKADFYYNATEYPLTFYDYDGTLIATYSVTFNSSIETYLEDNKPEPPVEDATWLGWYTDSLHEAKYEGNKKMPSGLALYANWQLPERTITFVDAFSGTEEVIKTDSCEYGKCAESITPAGHTGFEFAGWYTDTTYQTPYDFSKPLTENTTVYASWHQKPISYTVKYVDEEGNPVAEDRIVESPVYQKGDVVKEKPVSVTGMLPDASEKSLTLDYENNVITFVYTLKPAEITYTVKYLVYENHSVEVAAPKTKTLSGSFISVTEAAVAVDKQYMMTNYPDYATDDYYPEQDVITYEFTTGENIIVFLYHTYASGKIIVNYLDMDGNAIVGADQVTEIGKPGNAYHINTSVNGYSYYKTTDGTNEVSNTVTFKKGTIYRYVYLQKNLTITAKNKTKAYDGTPLYSEGAQDASVLGLVRGHALSSIEYDGSQTEGGSSSTVPKNAVIGGASSEYYKITYVPGTLTVTKKGITVTIAGDQITTVYDGNEHTAGYTVTSISDESFLEEYIQFNGTNSTVSLTHVGNVDLILKGMFSVKAEYAKSFDVAFKVSNGFVKITPRELTLTTGSAEKYYDGTPLTQSEGNSITGFADGESAYINANTGTITDVGSVENTYDKIVWDKALESDYTITTWNMGTLTVNPREITVNITGNKETVNYDGAEHSVEGYTVAISGDDSLGADYKYKEDYITYTGNKKATGTAVNEYPMGIDITKFTNTNSNYNVTFKLVEDGKLTIVGSKEIIVKITGKSDEVTYNGQKQSVSGYSVEIKNPEGIAVPYTTDMFTGPAQDAEVATASGTDADTYTMALSVEDFTNNKTDYSVTFVVTPGTLVINPVEEVVVTIEGNIGEKEYNGSEQSVTGYNVISISNNLFTENDIIALNTGIAKGTDVGKYEMGLDEEGFF